MNVAMQISGQLRQFQSYYNIYKSNILDTIDPDIFLSTWINNSHQRVKDEEDLEAYNQLYHPVLYEAHCFDTILKDDAQLSEIMNMADKATKLHTYRKHPSIIYMLYKRFVCNKMFQKYSNNYDVVILTRSDLILCEPLLYKHLEPALESLVVPLGADFENGICDILAIGPPKLIEQYCQLYLMMPEYIKLKVKIHPEHLLLYHLNYFQIPIKRISYTIHLNYRRMT